MRARRPGGARLGGVRVLPAVAAAVVGFAGCTSPSAAPGEPSPAPASASPSPSAVGRTPTPTPAAAESAAPAEPAPAEPEQCSVLVDRLTPEERIGQLFMVGKTSTEPVTDDYRQMLATTHVGSVVLLGNSREGTARVKELTDSLRHSAAAPQSIGLLIAVDQEGGQVQRLKGPGFDTMPPARVQANRPVPELERSATHWGRQLVAAGVDANLAPVADVVPANRVANNAPVGQLERHYGEAVAEVSPRVAAVVRGFGEAGITTSVKHFPGLGHVAGNTDFAAGVNDTSITRRDPGLAAFKAGTDAGADMVMIGTATYARIDPGVPAAFSSVVIERMVRQDMGFTGVVISDDLGVAQQVSDVPPGERAVRFLAAGGDLVINGDPRLQADMTRAVTKRAAADPAFADRLRVKAQRVVDMKARGGQVTCLPPA